MGVNATLFGQMITFGLLVIFTMKYVWPPIMQAMTERQQKIADGLAAAERGAHELELAQHKATDILRAAKLEAKKIVEQADKRCAQLVDEGKAQARVEADKIIQLAHSDIEKERQQVREELKNEVATIALAGAEKLLGKQLDSAANNAMLNDLIAEAFHD